MKKIQKKVKEFVQKHNLEHNAEITMLDLVSELGEVSKEILKSSDYGKRNSESSKEIESEIGDLFYSLINLANNYNIDLEKALDIVLDKYEKRLSKRAIVNHEKREFSDANYVSSNKVDREGHFKYYPGLTCIVKITKDTQAYKSLVEIQDKILKEFKVAELENFFKPVLSCSRPNKHKL